MFSDKVAEISLELHERVERIADGQLYHYYSVEGFILYRFLEQHGGQGAHEGGLFLTHVIEKGDLPLSNHDHPIIGIINWQSARASPGKEAFGPSSHCESKHPVPALQQSFP